MPGTEHPRIRERPTTFHATLAPPSLLSPPSSPSSTTTSNKRLSFDPRLAAWDVANARRTLPPRHSSIVPSSPLTSSPAFPSSALASSSALPLSPHLEPTLVSPSPRLGPTLTSSSPYLGPASTSPSPALSSISNAGVKIPSLPPGAQAPALASWVAKEARHRPLVSSRRGQLSPDSRVSKRQSCSALPDWRLGSRSPASSISPLPSPSPEPAQPSALPSPGPERTNPSPLPSPALERVQPSTIMPWRAKSTPPISSSFSRPASARLSLSALLGPPKPSTKSPSQSDKAGMSDPDARPRTRSTQDLGRRRVQAKLSVSTIASLPPAVRPSSISLSVAKPATTPPKASTQPAKPSITSLNSEAGPSQPRLPPGAAPLSPKVSAALAGVPLAMGPKTKPFPASPKPTAASSSAKPASTHSKSGSTPSLRKPANVPASHSPTIPALPPGARPVRAPPIIRPIPLRIDTAHRDVDIGRVFVPSGLPDEPPAYNPNWAVDTDPGCQMKN
ncbi:hypothetical protein CspHIS471_0604050 [Cutaneotrichosporon sp. HIS471]|nr:hypothetical protein CspHIS471_0604050 [Cutaneotrichosporon sp. HIS471]